MPWRGPDYSGEFPSLGSQVVDWIEKYLVHGPGDVIGERIELDDEFYAFVVRAYELDPQTGRKVKRRAVISRAKGRAKSELAGMLVCAEALGPVRFGGWDANGEPVGIPVKSPYIRCLATEEGQSGNTFENVSYMMQHIKERFEDDYPGIDIGKSYKSSSRIILHHHDGEIVPSTSGSASKDGGKETFAVFDETHLYKTNELKEMHKTVNRNLGKRKISQPWSLETSTMYRPGEYSIAEGTHSYFQDIKSGKIKGGDSQLLFDHIEAPLDTKLEDRDSLLKGLRIAYGPAAEWMDLDGIISIIYDPQNDAADSRRYYLNQVVSGSDSWMGADEWSAIADATKSLADGDVITLGFDGSIRDDATALVACRLSDGLLQIIGCWEKPDGPMGVGWQVPRVEVDEYVKATFETYRVVGFYADPAHWQDYIDRWQINYGLELEHKATQNNPIEWWTNKTTTVVRGLERFHTAVLDGGICHDGDTTLTRHVLNARRRYGQYGMTIAKEHPNSARKIDAAYASMLAYECRADAVAGGITSQKKRTAGQLFTF